MSAIVVESEKSFEAECDDYANLEFRPWSPFTQPSLIGDRGFDPCSEDMNDSLV